MNLYIGIKNGKIYDVCSDLSIKRDNTIEDKDYILREGNAGSDFQIDDTWDFGNDESLKDSIKRISNVLTIEKLELKMDLLESRLLTLEGK